MSIRLNDQLERILVKDRLRNVASSQVRLHEREAKMTVDVTGVRWRATTIHVDRIGGLSGLDLGDWNQKCDYLMVIDKGTTYCAAFIELKKTLNDEDPKPREQLRRSLPFLEYLRWLCCIHYEDAAPADIEVRYAVIGERGQLRLDKQAVKAKPVQPVWTKPHHGISVSAFLGPAVPLSALVGA